MPVKPGYVDRQTVPDTHVYYVRVVDRKRRRVGWKIGITRNDLGKRFERLPRSTDVVPLMLTPPMLRDDALMLEREVLDAHSHWLVDKHDAPDMGDAGGLSEIFTDDVLRMDPESDDDMDATVAEANREAWLVRASEKVGARTAEKVENVSSAWRHWTAEAVRQRREAEERQRRAAAERKRQRERERKNLQRLLDERQGELERLKAPLEAERHRVAHKLGEEALRYAQRVERVRSRRTLRALASTVVLLAGGYALATAEATAAAWETTVEPVMALGVAGVLVPLLSWAYNLANPATEVVAAQAADDADTRKLVDRMREVKRDLATLKPLEDEIAALVERIDNLKEDNR